MPFPTRPVLAVAVLGALVASGSTALTLPGRASSGHVAVPEFNAPSQPQSASTPLVPIATTPPITGAQIAALAIAPARERATALVAEQARLKAEADAAAAAAAPPAAEPRRGSEADRLRQELRRACASGALRGSICRGA